MDYKAIAELLKYGFFAVSIIMIYLGYSLTKEVISYQETSIEKINSAKFFLVMALLFLIVGGSLEIYRTNNSRTIVLSIEPWHQKYEQRFGELKIRYGAEKFNFNDNCRELKIKNNGSIDIEIYSLVEIVDKLQSQLNNSLVQKQDFDKEIGISEEL